MAELDRRPTAEELDELLDLVRRDPSTPEFVDLGDSYLALGRPRDAIEVGMAGLAASPENLEGRVMVARALMSLHQWKEAQVELLRVVKTDRSNRLGFVLLGEVLMRRSDFERALPVLQHAQNLDPANPDVLVMLKRARSSQPLDAPPPIPTPISPAPGAAARGKGKPPAPPATGKGTPLDIEDVLRGDPTEIAPPPVFAKEPAAAPMVKDAKDVKGRPAPPGKPPVAAPPVVGADGIVPRPRVIPAVKTVNAAAESLRKSAAVGETYLNDLLTGGLLDVPGVAVPDINFDIKPDRRWGRSTTRTFIILFVVLFLGVGGGGAWYWWSETQRKDAIAQHRGKAARVMVTASWDALETALTELRAALDLDPASTLTMAEVAEVAALETLLYGVDDDRVDTAVKVAARDIDEPAEAGYRELLIARSAVELSRLARLEAPATVLATVRGNLDAWLETRPDDAWARWLSGRAMLAAGERGAAHTAIAKAAEAKGEGAVIATIDRADLLADEGKYDEAIELHDKALEIAAEHPLAILGRVLARAERGTDSIAVMDDLNVHLDKKLGPRVEAYRQLALAMAHYALEDYVRFDEALRAATGPTEGRFVARVALAHILQGDLAGAAKARDTIAWYGKNKPEPDPLVALVDAGLALAAGLPEKALDVAKGDSVRAMLLRGQALLDLGRAKDAVAELDRARTASPENIEAQILREWARALAATGKDRAAALDALEKVARKAKTKLGRHALGAALLATGASPADARKRLEQAITDVTEEAPNPVAYRTHTLLAELELGAGNLDAATAQIELATKANSGYLPALALRARLVLAKGDPDAALDLLRPVVKEKVTLAKAVELTLAEALIRHKGATEQDRTDAVAALERAKAAGASPEEIGRVAFLIDPALPEKLGATPPKIDDGGKDKKPRSSDRRSRGRRGR